MELPKRKKIRLEGYDYSQNGSYFVTICTKYKECLFGDISNHILKISENGLIVQTNIEKLNNLYNGITVDKYVVMPNHIHMIITICRERIVCVPNVHTKSQLSKIIQIFKSSITKEIRNYLKQRNSCNYNTYNLRNACNAFPTGEIWQKSYHDHIIRNEQEYQKIWQYINENPLKWEVDLFYHK